MAVFLKTKETIMKSIEADNKRFKQIYTEKMRKMVGECTNMVAF